MLFVIFLSMKDTYLEKKKEFHKKYIKTKEFEEVRQAVFERDGHKCVLCGRTDNLVCHHTVYRHLGLHNQAEIDDCITLCQKDHLNHHSGKYNIYWYSPEHPRNCDDLREVEIEGVRVLVRSNGVDFFDAETYKRYKAYFVKRAGNRPGGYYGINLKGKHNRISVHRLIAKAFPEICGEWFDDCEVHHLDGNKENNRADNLKVLTKEEHYKLHHEEKSELTRKIKKLPILQYTLSGLFVAKWNSIHDAVKKYGGGVQHCLNGRNHTAGDYIWKYADTEEIELWIEPFDTNVYKTTGKSVLKYSLDGEFLGEFKSAQEALNSVGGKSVSSISCCCKGIYKSSFGFVWKYKQ